MLCSATISQLIGKSSVTAWILGWGWGGIGKRWSWFVQDLFKIFSPYVCLLLYVAYSCSIFLFHWFFSLLVFSCQFLFFVCCRTILSYFHWLLPLLLFLPGCRCNSSCSDFFFFYFFASVLEFFQSRSCLAIAEVCLFCSPQVDLFACFYRNPVFICVDFFPQDSFASASQYFFNSQSIVFHNYLV
jgi:hypothetical protein